MKTVFLRILVASFVLGGNAAWAGSDVNADSQGVALHGYDPVAYHAAGKPTKGQVKHQASHRGTTYYFSSAANRDRFQGQPDRYIPQYGGYCAMGAALGKKLDVDPLAWRIVDGKLYLNVNADIQRKWLTDVHGHIAQADRNWSDIRDKDPRGLQ
jgi:YHS domain-containing protein